MRDRLGDHVRAPVRRDEDRVRCSPWMASGSQSGGSGRRRSANAIPGRPRAAAYSAGWSAAAITPRLEPPASSTTGVRASSRPAPPPAQAIPADSRCAKVSRDTERRGYCATLSLQRIWGKLRRGGAVHTVYLLRHAKSDWSDQTLPDHGRPLAPRGRRDAKRIAKHLRRRGIEPALVLCSSAERARETLELVWPALGATPAQIGDELYAASGDELLKRLRLLPEESASVLLIGHNPGPAGPRARARRAESKA